MARVRDFNPATLVNYKSQKLHVAQKSTSLFQGKAWIYFIFLPRWVIIENERRPVCTVYDENLLRRLLESDFGGYTSEPSFPRGTGHRGDIIETNLHRKFSVIASSWRGTIQYFKALRRELEACSGEEQILILRQKLHII